MNDREYLPRQYGGSTVLGAAKSNGSRQLTIPRAIAKLLPHGTMAFDVYLTEEGILYVPQNPDTPAAGLTKPDWLEAP